MKSLTLRAAKYKAFTEVCITKHAG